MLTYEIKYMSSKNEKISKKLINNIKISRFNDEFERYYKTLWKLAPQEIINILMNYKITNFKEYVYNYS